MSVFENVSFILPLFISFLLIIKNDESNIFADSVVCKAYIIKALLSAEAIYVLYNTNKTYTNKIYIYTPYKFSKT